MTHTIHIFSEDHTTPAAGVDYIPPIADETIRTQGDFLFIKHMQHLIGGTGFGGAAFAPTRMWFESPHLKQLNYFEITPVETALIPAEAIDYRIQPEDPIVLPVSEAVRCVLEGAAGNVLYVSGCIWLADGPLTPVHGEIFHARLTATITEVVGAWAHGEMTYDQPLAVGRYAIVGARCQCTDDGAYFRLISLDQVSRPGGIAVNGVECPDLREQRNGGLGVWMEFDHDSPPELEVFASVGGDAAQEVTLDLIKLS